MDLFLYKDVADSRSEDFASSELGLNPDIRSDLDLLDNIKRVKHEEDFNLEIPGMHPGHFSDLQSQRLLTVPPYEQTESFNGLLSWEYEPISNEINLNMPALKEESETFQVEGTDCKPKAKQPKVKSKKRQRASPLVKAQSNSGTNQDPKAVKAPTTPKAQRAKRTKSSPKTGKKSLKRQRLTKAQKNRMDAELERYLQLRKKAKLQDKNDSGEYLCPFPGCSFKVEDFDVLNNHMDLHKEGQRRHFRCTDCPEVFYSSGCLTSHMITHSRGGSTNFCCSAEGCGKRYATAEGLRLHTRNHHQVNKTWKCMADGCKISFVRKSDLQMHIIRMHSVERPYPCSACDKSFACHSEVRRHLLKMHGIETPKLSKDGIIERPKSAVFEKLIQKATVYRDKLRAERAAEKARLAKARKAFLRAQKAMEKEAKRAKKRAERQQRAKRT